MSMVSLSVPAIIINNEVFRIVPNSFKYDGGEGEIMVRSASGGGRNSETVHSANAETFIGKCTFEAYLVAELDNRIATWKENIGNNSIQAIQRPIGGGDTVTLSWDGMSLTNEVERAASADGTVSLEWMGEPMVQQ